MANIIESGIGTLNYGRQTAKGTKATAATTTIGYDRPKWQGGALKPAKVLGRKEYIDGNRFASPSPYTDRVGGEVGSLTLQIQPENAGLYAAQILGVDTVTGASDPWTHTITSAGTSGAWGTWWLKAGSAVINRQMWWDAKIAKSTWTSNFTDKVLLNEIDIQALKAAEVFTTDAAKTETQTDPFLHTEATGSFTIDSLVVNEVNEAIVTVDTKMQPYWGDSIEPLHLVEGKGEITLSMKAILTDDTLGRYRKAIYNTASPTAGTLPVKDVFSAAASWKYTRSATRTFEILAAKVDVEPADMVVGAQPEGGTVPLEFSGVCRKDGATAALRMIALSGDSTTYA